MVEGGSPSVFVHYLKCTIKGCQEGQSNSEWLARFEDAMLVVEQRFCGLRKSDKFGGTWIPFSVNNLRLAMCSFARVTSVIRRGPARNNANAVPNWVASQRCKPTVQKSGLLARLSLALAFVFPLLTLFV